MSIANASPGSATGTEQVELDYAAAEETREKRQTRQKDKNPKLSPLLRKHLFREEQWPG